MQFEKDTLVFDQVDQKLEYTGERYIPQETSDEMTIEHMQRYFFAKEFVKNKIILDAACGEGYGSHVLNEEANKVYAIDLDENAIKEAQKKYREDNIQFTSSSIEKLQFKDKMFDTIVSFETIEHVTEDIQKSFLKEVSRTLKEDGVFVVSTPNKYIYTDKVGVKNPYHQKEFYQKEFLEFLSEFFEYTYVFNQYFRLGYFIDQENKTSSLNLDSIDAEDARYYIVICSHHELQIDMSKSYEVFDNSMYFELFKNCNKLDKEMITLNKDFKEFRYNSKEYINHIENDIKELNGEIIHRDKDIVQLNAAIEHRDKDIEELKSVIEHRDKDIEELKSVIEALRNHNESLIEKIEHPIKNIVEKIYNKTKR